MSVVGLSVVALRLKRDILSQTGGEVKTPPVAVLLVTEDDFCLLNHVFYRKAIQGEQLFSRC